MILIEDFYLDFAFDTVTHFDRFTEQKIHLEKYLFHSLVIISLSCHLLKLRTWRLYKMYRYI